MIDNSEWERLLAKLESLEDEEYAAQLLSELNMKSKKLGQLILNQDQNLEHSEWKAQCDLAKEELDRLLKTLDQL